MLLEGSERHSHMAHATPSDANGIFICLCSRVDLADLARSIHPTYGGSWRKVQSNTRGGRPVLGKSQLLVYVCLYEHSLVRLLVSTRLIQLANSLFL